MIKVAWKKIHNGFLIDKQTVQVKHQIAELVKQRYSNLKGIQMKI